MTLSSHLRDSRERGEHRFDHQKSLSTETVNLKVFMSFKQEKGRRLFKGESNNHNNQDYYPD